QFAVVGRLSFDNRPASGLRRGPGVVLGHAHPELLDRAAEWSRLSADLRARRSRRSAPPLMQSDATAGGGSSVIERNPERAWRREAAESDPTPWSSRGRSRSLWSAKR